MCSTKLTLMFLLYRVLTQKLENLEWKMRIQKRYQFGDPQNCFYSCGMDSFSFSRTEEEGYKSHRNVTQTHLFNFLNIDVLELGRNRYLKYPYLCKYLSSKDYFCNP